MAKKGERSGQRPAKRKPARFGKLLLFYRRRAGFTLASLSRSVGLDSDLLSKFERGVRRPPDLAAVRNLAGVLGLVMGSAEFNEFLATAWRGRYGEAVPDRLLGPSDEYSIAPGQLHGLPVGAVNELPLVDLTGAAANLATASILDPLEKAGQLRPRSNDQAPLPQESPDTPEAWGQMLHRWGLGVWLYRTLTNAGFPVTQFGYDKHSFSFEVELPDGKRHRLGVFITVT
jgi:transcriptional regulator with XRE-family HTH domain